ncbi:hypothetical protein G4G27_13665 [Sphingomonas sp. So64.6b]|uniref:hypothetical protein n=1 Tax=Sphingomonas sp. So64.6b TaxID=2997354 RepID=UPI0015FF0194|nr:hypothetical protein [Sphingomonas sp. So64.6b]QNA84926.1 hypothetical protein G4G27_13665 [Sphingomonas sp. So64.6b]
MGDVFQLLIIVACVAFPFVAMPLMWRRMKRVRNQSYEGSEPVAHQEPWQEPIRSADGVSLSRANSPNDDLIALGAKATRSRWPLDNQ